MGRILDLHCLESAEASRLVEFGIASTDRLLLIAAHKQGREDIAEETGIKEDRILQLVHVADLMRVKGVGPEYCLLLDHVGVHTLKQLGRRSAERLYEDLIDRNEEGRLVRRLPSPSDVDQWVDGARLLDSVIRY